MIRASAPYASGWSSFVLLKMDRVRVARGGSLTTLHRSRFILLLRVGSRKVSIKTWFLKKLRNRNIQKSKTKMSEAFLNAVIIDYLNKLKLLSKPFAFVQ